MGGQAARPDTGQDPSRPVAAPTFDPNGAPASRDLPYPDHGRAAPPAGQVLRPGPPRTPAPDQAATARPTTSPVHPPLTIARAVYSGSMVHATIGIPPPPQALAAQTPTIAWTMERPCRRKVNERLIVPTFALALSAEVGGRGGLGQRAPRDDFGGRPGADRPRGRPDGRGARGLAAAATKVAHGSETCAIATDLPSPVRREGK